MKEHILNQIIEKGYDKELSLFEDEIIALQEPKLSYMFLQNNRISKHRNAHINIIIQGNDMECLFGILCGFSDIVNVQECLDIISEKGDASINYKVVEKYGFKEKNDSINIDISKNIEAILNSTDPKSNFLLATKIKTYLTYIDSLSDVEKEYYSLNGDIERKYLQRCLDNIIKSKDLEHLYLYAKEIETNQEIADIILNSKSGKYNYLYARDIPNADKEKHYQAVLDSKELEYIYNVALDISNISEREKVHNIMNNKEIKISISEFLDFIINSNDPEYNFLAAKEIKGADKKAHLDVVIDSLDPKYNYLAVEEIKGADFRRHEIAVLLSDDLEYNYLFARFKGADVKAHERVILAFEDAKFSRYFIGIPGADYDAHYQIIVNNKYGEQIEKDDIVLRLPPTKNKTKKLLLLLEEQKKLTESGD